MDDRVTLVVAIVGLALAVASLVWQAATFVLAGARIKVRLQQGAIGNGSAIVGPLDARIDFEDLRNQGFTQPVLAIEVRNVGRMPISVTGWHAVLENRMSYTDARSPVNPELSFRLEPQSKQTWYVELNPLHAAVSASHSAGIWPVDHQKVWMSVDLGNGKTVRTREFVRIGASDIAEGP